MKKLLVVLAAVLFVQPLWARPCDNDRDRDTIATNVAVAPVYVFTNGPGAVYVFALGHDRHDCEQIRQVQAGSLLPVGSQFALLAVPASGYQFTNWNEVNIINLTQTIVDSRSGVPVTNRFQSTILQQQPPLAQDTDPVLMQQVSPVVIVYSSITTNFGGNSFTNSELTSTQGWQANFVALPPRPPVRHR